MFQAEAKKQKRYSTRSQAKGKKETGQAITTLQEQRLLEETVRLTAAASVKEAEDRRAAKLAAETPEDEVKRRAEATLAAEVVMKRRETITRTQGPPEVGDGAGPAAVDPPPAADDPPANPDTPENEPDVPEDTGKNLPAKKVILISLAQLF